LFGRHDPDQFSFCLECQNLFEVEEKIYCASSANDLSTCRGSRRERGRGDLGNFVGDFERVVPQTPGALDAFAKSSLTDRLQ
jgi:hypothetical protein